MMMTMSGSARKDAWEDYARMTFEAHRKHVPAHQLRFLQYVKKDTAACWGCQRQHGAVLLGKAAEENGLVTIAPSAFTMPFSDLSPEAISYREEREQIVTLAVNQSLAAAQALHEIKTYRDGLLWRKDFRSFEDYCSHRWNYQKSQAYRHVQAGSLLARLAQSHSPIGENSGITESHLRPVIEMVPDDLQVECWKEVTQRVPDGVKRTAALVKKETQRFLKDKGIEPKQKKRPQPTKPNDRSIALSSIKKLEVELGKVVPKAGFQPLLDQLIQMIEDAQLADSQ